MSLENDDESGNSHSDRRWDGLSELSHDFMAVPPPPPPLPTGGPQQLPPGAQPAPATAGGLGADAASAPVPVAPSAKEPAPAARVPPTTTDEAGAATRAAIALKERTPDPVFVKLPLVERLKQQPPLKVQHIYMSSVCDATVRRCERGVGVLGGCR